MPECYSSEMNIDWRIISALINKARIRTAGYSQSTHRELRTISSDDEATEGFVVLGTAVGEGGMPFMELFVVLDGVTEIGVG